MDKMKNDYNIAVSAPLGYNKHLRHERPGRRSPSSYQLETLTDLMAVAPELRLGCTADFTQREDALPPSGVHLQHRVRRGQRPGRGRALHRHRQRPGGRHRRFATDAFSPSLTWFSWRMMPASSRPTTRSNFIRQECLDKYPELEEVLALLDGRISNEAMAAMNAEVDLEAETPPMSPMTSWWKRAYLTHTKPGFPQLVEPRFLFFVLTQPMNIASPKEKKRYRCSTASL